MMQKPKGELKMKKLYLFNCSLIGGICRDSAAQDDYHKYEFLAALPMPITTTLSRRRCGMGDDRHSGSTPGPAHNIQRTPGYVRFSLPQTEDFRRSGSESGSQCGTPVFGGVKSRTLGRTRWRRSDILVASRSKGSNGGLDAGMHLVTLH